MPENSGRLLEGRVVRESVLLFAAAAVVLFLFSNRMLGMIDDGIALTGVMQTMAGRVLHRDFYFDYGPAELYMDAGLFKLFGTSVLVSRLASVLWGALLAVTMYVLTRKYCGRALALGAVIVGVVWMIGVTLTASMMNPPLAVMTIWISWLILPIADKRLQRRRALWAGFLTGMMFLFRYDSGVAMLGVELLAVVIIMWMEERQFWRPLKGLAATVMGPCIAAFIVTVLPFAIWYVSVAPLHDLLYDVVIYMGKYYRAGRGLPLPPLEMGEGFGRNAIYVLPVLIGLGLWLAIFCAIRNKRLVRSESAVAMPDWAKLLITLSLAAAVFCAKGFVRVGIDGMTASVAACVLIAALLLKHRAMLSLWLRGLLTLTVGLFVLTGLAAAHFHVATGVHLKTLAINRILTPNRQPPWAPVRGWCHEGTPITKGFCYLLENDRIQTVTYLRAHTSPGDFLFVALDHNDRIFATDMITYFATQRLPATKWAQFDPYLQNRADIQREIIADLERHRPPYIVLDSEFDNVREPNGSSVSTGVHLLDDYIAAHYRAVQQYGRFTIVQRQG